MLLLEVCKIKMGSKNNCFEITGQLEYFTEEFKNILIRWCSENNYDYAYILHDKDRRFNEDTKEEEIKPVHIHFLINTGASRWAFPALLQRFKRYGLLSTMLQKVRKGWHNALSYLVHRTEGAVNDGKHMYDLKEVVSNFDYIKTIDVIETQVEEKKTRIDEVIDKIKNLECRRYNYYKYIDIEDYTKKGNKMRIDLAFQYVETRLSEEQKGREMKVIWIYGESGIGKTTLAKIICENSKWSYAVSSSSNDPLQDYKGQDALILDDFRLDGWSRSDVLKMLDNNTISSIKSRYQNKLTCYLRAIIVTSVQSPYLIWMHGEQTISEPYEQLSRRISEQIEMFKDKEEGVNARTYFTVKRSGFNGAFPDKKFDFTSQLEALKLKMAKEQEEEEIMFSGISCVGSSSFSVKIDGEKVNVSKDGSIKVDESDIPF